MVCFTKFYWGRGRKIVKKIEEISQEERMYIISSKKL